MFMALLHALLLGQLKRYATGRHDRPQVVDRIEVNHYWWVAGCESHQVIIWRWSHKEAQFQAERFFFLRGDGSDLPRQVGDGVWRFTYRDEPRGQRAVVFETVDLIETVTAYDPWNRARAA